MRPMKRLFNLAKECLVRDRPYEREAIWRCTEPDSGTWAEVLWDAPIIIQILPSTGFPLGAASAIGPLLKRKSVHFIVMNAWSLEVPRAAEALAETAAAYLYDHPRHQLTFLGNTEHETALMRAQGYFATTINQNCLVNDAMFRPLPDIEPIYDAVYNARLCEDKRNELAREINRTAFIYYYFSGDNTLDEFHARQRRLAAMMPDARMVNELTPDGCQFISWEDINLILAQSRVGLCLSPVEGAMRASIEYLFAGLSVVSTPSLGGRDYFFDDEYCIICEADPRSVREAAEALIARNVPRDYVRAKTLGRVEAERRRYIDLVQDLIDRAGQRGNFEDRFWKLTRGESIIHWLKMSEFATKISPLASRIKFKARTSIG